MADVTDISPTSELDAAAAVPPPGPSAEERLRERRRDQARLKTMGQRHGATVLAVLTLFGAAHAWATTTDWLLAALVAPLVAFMAGTVVASITHEWGHFAGARLAGAVSPVNSKPYRWFFIFNFDESNSTSQGLWMSWGGQVGSWLAVAAIAVLVPMDSLVSAVLLATVLGRAVNASFFEIPVMIRARRSDDLQAEIDAQLASPGIVQWPGLFVGLATLLIVVR